jgi:formimidoylglutamate deiminase
LKTVLNGIDDDARVPYHVAEQTKEVEDCAPGLATADQFLFDQFDVSERWCAIHATHMTAGETQRLARSGAIAGLCPTTEANLGDGIFPADSFMKQGGAIAIGSDSQITISPAEDLRMLEYSQRLRDRTRNALASGPGLQRGAACLMPFSKAGPPASISPWGRLPWASAVTSLLDDEHPAMIGREGDAVLDTWIFSAGNAAVKDVIVGGSHVVKDRLHIDEDRIQMKFTETVRRLS